MAYTTHTPLTHTPSPLSPHSQHTHPTRYSVPTPYSLAPNTVPPHTHSSHTPSPLSPHSLLTHPITTQSPLTTHTPHSLLSPHSQHTHPITTQSPLPTHTHPTRYSVPTPYSHTPYSLAPNTVPPHTHSSHTTYASSPGHLLGHFGSVPCDDLLNLKLNDHLLPLKVRKF